MSFSNKEVTPASMASYMKSYKDNKQYVFTMYHQPTPRGNQTGIPVPWVGLLVCCQAAKIFWWPCNE